MYSDRASDLSPLYAERNSENDRGLTRISSPLPLNSVMTSDERNLELDPVTYTSRLLFLRSELIMASNPSASCISSRRT